MTPLIFIICLLAVFCAWKAGVAHGRIKESSKYEWLLFRASQEIDGIAKTIKELPWNSVLAASRGSTPPTSVESSSLKSPEPTETTFGSN